VKNFFSRHISLRNRLILTSLALTGIPLIILVGASYSLLDTGINIGVNQPLEQGLNAALAIADKSYQENVNRISFQIVNLSYEPELRNKNRLQNTESLLKSAIRSNDLDAIELYDAEGALIHFVCKSGYEDQIPMTDRDRVIHGLQSKFDLVHRSGSENRILKAGKAIENGHGQIIGMLVGNQVFPEDYVRNLNEVQIKSQFYTEVDMLRGRYFVHLFGSFLALAFVVAVAAVIASIYLARKFTEPIGQLVQATHELAKGNMGYQLQRLSRDEIGELMNSFNRMSRDLEENRKKLIHAERIAAWQGIARRLAHEIKNPLTPIQLSIQHLRDEYNKGNQDFSETFSECTETIIQEVDGLRRMVQEFSEFARMPAPNFQETDIGSILKELVSFFATAHPAIRFTLQSTDPLPSIEADAERLRRVLINLIENATHAVMNRSIKKIRIQANYAEGDSTMYIHLEDTGYGIPRDRLERVFQPYFTTKENGTGLGLSIVDRIIQDHNGRVTAESEVGKGARFDIQLPIFQKRE